MKILVIPDVHLKPDILWYYGNHDLSYIWKCIETGYSGMVSITVQRKLLELKEALPDNNPIKYVQRIDNVLFSHGGVSDFLVRECVKYSMYNDVDSVLDTINCMRKQEMWKRKLRAPAP